MTNLATALALIAALATCDSAWCIEDAVEPLTALANALSAAGQHAAAIEALTRAVGILRRSSGLYDERQYSLLSQLADLHSLSGDTGVRFRQAFR